MTPEEKASWQRWHEYGRHRYQLRAALRGVLVVLAATVLNMLLHRIFGSFDMYRYIIANPAGTLLAAMAWGLSVYFFAGHHWDARDEEYRWLSDRDSHA